MVKDFLAKSVQQTTTFTVGYDYGFHMEDKAVALLDGNKVFFNPSDYGVETLLAGDKVTVTYVGEMLMQETYPGTIIIHGDLKNLSIELAPIAQYTYQNGDWYVCQGENKTRLEVSLPEYVSSEDMSFYASAELQDGATVYGTCKTDEKGKTYYESIYAVYDYKPR